MELDSVTKSKTPLTDQFVAVVFKSDEFHQTIFILENGMLTIPCSSIATGEKFQESVFRHVKEEFGDWPSAVPKNIDEATMIQLNVTRYYVICVSEVSWKNFYVSMQDLFPSRSMNTRRQGTKLCSEYIDIAFQNSTSVRFSRELIGLFVQMRHLIVLHCRT